MLHISGICSISRNVNLISETNADEDDGVTLFVSFNVAIVLNDEAIDIPVHVRLLGRVSLSLSSGGDEESALEDDMDMEMGMVNECTIYSMAGIVYCMYCRAALE